VSARLSTDTGSSPRGSPPSMRAASADAGVAVAFFDIMAIAFGVQNVGGNWNRSSPLAMPRRTRLGFTMNYTDPQETLRLLSTVEIQWPEGQESRVLLGGEAGVAVKGIGIVGRVGYATAPQPFVRSHISLGASVYVSALKLDYAYREADVLDMRAHYFGLRLTL
jgi:hypothetical protein